MTKPSKFIMNSDYTTPMNDDKASFSVNIGNSYTIPAGGNVYLVNRTFGIGEASSGIRFLINSSRWGGQWLTTTSNFSIKAKLTTSMFSLDTIIGGRVTREGSNIRITIEAWDEFGTGGTLTDCAQTITIAVENFKSPFTND